MSFALTSNSEHYIETVGIPPEFHSREDLIHCIELYRANPSFENQLQLFLIASRYSESLNQDFSIEHVRQSTFEPKLAQSVWSTSNPSPTSMTKAGLFFLGVIDMTMCFSCKRVFFGWKSHQTPWVKHAERSPHCVFVTENRSNNPEWKTRVIPRSLRTPPSDDWVKKYYNPKITTIISTFGAAHCLKNADLAARIKTFDKFKWDETIHPPIKIMAKAGFYCKGKDHVICYYCSGEFENWGKETNPFIEHKYYHPWCFVVKTAKYEAQLKQEVETVESFVELLYCHICTQYVADFAIIPCGHKFCKGCVSCFSACPMCRCKFREVLKLH